MPIALLAIEAGENDSPDTDTLTCINRVRDCVQWNVDAGGRWSTLLETGHSAAEFRDMADDLVAGDHWINRAAPAVVYLVKICAESGVSPSQEAYHSRKSRSVRS